MLKAIAKALRVQNLIAFPTMALSPMQASKHLNLNPAHHYVILNVYAFLLLLISCTLLLIVSIGQVSLVCGTHLVVDLLLIKCRIVINLLLLVLVLLLHLVTGRSSYADAQVVVVVFALSLIILHLKQVIILLL